MKKLLLLLLLTTTTIISYSQHISKNAHVKFYSHAPTEDIEAHNHSAQTAINLGTGDVVFKILIRSFEFKKALMQEHFNENYMESDKFPTATFVGKITDLTSLDVNIAGPQEVEVKGKITIHGVTKDLTAIGTVEIKGETVIIHSVFKLKVADFDIEIPKMVINNIAKELEVTVDGKLTPLKK